MRTTELYTCEKCGKEFKDKDDCRNHETVCRKMIEVTEHKLGLMEGLIGRASTFVSLSRGKWNPDSLVINKVSVRTYCNEVAFVVIAPSSRPSEEAHRQLLDYAIAWLDRMGSGLRREREELEKEVKR